MENEPVQWSEENQKRLQERLCGMWAEDTWIFTPTNPKYKRWYLRFTLTSPSLNVELKYAVWCKLNERQKNLDWSARNLRSALNRLFAWLNQFEPAVRSLMDKRLEQWEESFRSFLVLKGKLHPKKLKRLLSTQRYVEYQLEDESIGLLRRLYKIISEAYDDRPETEKDVWDVRAMGLAPDLLYGRMYLNFTPITQPWLQSLAKEFIRYKIGIRSFTTCLARLSHIVSFSRFLSQQYPTVDASGIDGQILGRYMSYVNGRGLGIHRRYNLLSGLRDFFETCSSRLGLKDSFRETLIFSSDFPEKPEGNSREIPEPVLVQLREQLETLPTTELRMVVILLECGMRIGELCALPFDCLIDGEHGWYLRSYQFKMKQEHIIPLVDDTVVKAIQAQQQEVRTSGGKTCPYLFPRPGSPTRPFAPALFSHHLNKWALERNIRDAEGNFFRFQSHQFRHTVGMRLLNEDVPIEIIGRLLGHYSLKMTQVYARKRTEKQRDELERLARRRKTVNYLGQTVTGDARANDPDAQLLRKGIRGQTLAVGG